MSELDDRLLEGRAAVATMDPPADLWTRVLERATNGDAVVHELTAAPPTRRPPLWLAVASVAAALAIVVGLTRFDDDQTVDTDVPQVTAPAPSVTSVVPDATAPPPATNGWVAFAAGQPSDGDIYLVRPGEDARRVEVAGSDAAHDSCPTWSPDGTRLAFGRLTASSDGASSVAELVLVPIGRDGAVGAPNVIALDGFRPLPGFDPHPCATWAADGRWVAFVGNGEVWVADTGTGEIRRLPGLRPFDLDWRPGTDELAIAGDVGPNREAEFSSTPVTLYAASTGELRELGSVRAANVTWSPDGSTLAYQGGENDAQELWLVDADGTDERLLTRLGNRNHGVGPTWSPSGDRIVYQRLISSGERHEVVLVDVADGTETVIAPPETDGATGARTWYPSSVTWSPDGTTLLYSASGLLAVPVATPTEATVLTEADVAADEYSHQWTAVQAWGRQPG